MVAFLTALHLCSSEVHQLLPGKFGNHFEKRVANHSDILLFKKAVVRNAADEKVGTTSNTNKTVYGSCLEQ